MYKFRSVCEGITLIELMIAMVLSLCVIASLQTIFFTANKNNQIIQTQQDIQSRIMQLTTMLHHAMQTAGYIGCAELTPDFPLYNHTSYLFTSQNKVIGDNKILTIKGGSLPGVRLIEPMKLSNFIITDSKFAFNKEDIVIISDCASAEIFQIKSVERQGNFMKITATTPLQKLFPINAELRHYEENTYFVKDTGRLDYYRKPIFGLFKKNIHHHVSELIEGINKLNLRYDISQNNALVSVDKMEDANYIRGVEMTTHLSALKNLIFQTTISHYISIKE